MDEETQEKRRKSRDDKIYNALIDAEQEIWNRRAPIRAHGYKLANVTALTRLWQKVWYSGCDLVDLTLGPEEDYDKYKEVVIGTYADIEDTDGEYKRTITGRERFRILEKPHKQRSKVICRALRIEATDYSATYNLTLSRAVVLMILLQVVVAFVVAVASCPSGGPHHDGGHR